MSDQIIKLLPCEVIIDLLPLYADEVCSTMSKELVEQHLKGCEDCQSELRMIKKEVFQTNVLEEGEMDAGFTMQKALKSVRRKWALSIAAVILFMTVVTTIICERKGVGIELGQCYASVMNTGNFIRSKGMKEALEENDLEGLFECFNINELYRNMKNETVQNIEGHQVKVANMDREGFQELCKQKFISKMEEFEGKGYPYTEIKVIDAKRIKGENYIKIAIGYQKGEKEEYDFIKFKEVDRKFLCEPRESQWGDSSELEQIFSFDLLLHSNQ